MKHFIFSEGEPDHHYTFDYEPALFNIREHRLLQRNDGWTSFYILNTKHNKVAGSVHFNVSHETAQSPLRAPFGSFEVSQTVPPSVLYDFIVFVESQLRQKKIREIKITSPSMILGGSTIQMLTVFLFNLGYRVIEAETGTVIPISEIPFAHHINTWEKRKIRQAKNQNLVFKEMDVNNFTLVYDFILQCREEKGYPLSMSHDDLLAVVRAFPDRFKFFAVYEGDELAAGTIAIRVHTTVLYNFYAAHSKKYNPLSPVVLLIENLYEYCQKQKIAFLDLGTSALNGQPNFGLMEFKIHLGGKPTPKLTFEKILS